uniref:Uncharacterized protein n=1 Tax=Glossina pallidipes TaxID=7398 RepID=A0A1B0A834_GLOPL
MLDSAQVKILSQLCLSVTEHLVCLRCTVHPDGKNDENSYDDDENDTDNNDNNAEESVMFLSFASCFCSIAFAITPLVCSMPCESWRLFQLLADAGRVRCVRLK